MANHATPAPSARPPAPKWVYSDRDGLRGPALHLHSLLAQAWDEGFQAACDETPMDHTPDGPTDAQNPYGGAA